MKIQYIILEEKKDICNELISLLEAYKELECVGEFSSIPEAADYIQEHKVDVVFANCELGDARNTGDTNYMCNYWSHSYPDMMTILYGREKEMAFQCIKQNSKDYFVVPVEPLEMQRIVSHIRYNFELLKYKREARNRMILIKTKNGYRLIERDQILFVERVNRKNRLVTAEGKEIGLAGYSMDELENLLSECGFYRCYQSYIVNLSKVSAIHVNSEKKVYTLQFFGYDEEIILSREKYAEILELLRAQYAKVSL